MVRRAAANFCLVGLILWWGPIDPHWWVNRAAGREWLALFLCWGGVEWMALVRQARAQAAGQPVPPMLHWVDRALAVGWVAVLTVSLRWWGGGAPDLPGRLGLGVVFLVGAGLRGWAMATLGSNFSQHVITSPPHVRSGPYRWFRHPGYVGLLLIWSSLIGWLQSPWGLVGVWGVLAPLLWVRGRAELTPP